MNVNIYHEHKYCGKASAEIVTFFLIELLSGVILLYAPPAAWTPSRYTNLSSHSPLTPSFSDM